jgi:hypothetical protein
MKTQSSKIKNQNYNSKLKIFLLFPICLFVYLLICLFSPAQAQEFSAGINPMVLTIDAKVPADIKAPVTLENSSDQNITYNIFLRPFKPGAEKNGEPSYDTDVPPEYKAFFENVWLTDEKGEVSQITLSPSQKKDLLLNIKLNQDETPKDYYFTVVFLTDSDSSEKTGSSSGAKGGIGMNVLLSIGPKSEPEGRIADFSFPKLVSHGPFSFSVEIANDNDYYVISSGNLVIKNMFGQIVGNLDIKPTNILANSTRLMSNSDQPQEKPSLIWNENFLFGFYKADINVAISDKGPLIKQSGYFFAFPLELVVGVIVLIVLIIALYKRVKQKRVEID